jgi:hypothetical protein
MGIFRSTALGAAALALSAGVASASTTIMENGESFGPLGPGTWDFVSGGATAFTTNDAVGDPDNPPRTTSLLNGFWRVGFETANAGQGEGFATLTTTGLNSFTNLRISWLDADSNLLSSSLVGAISRGSAEGEANISFLEPFELVRYLQVSWDTAAQENVNFTVSAEISVVPLPATAFLMLGGVGVFGGIAALKRRRLQKASV